MPKNKLPDLIDLTKAELIVIIKSGRVEAKSIDWAIYQARRQTLSKQAEELREKYQSAHLAWENNRDPGDAWRLSCWRQQALKQLKAKQAEIKRLLAAWEEIYVCGGIPGPDTGVDRGD